MLLLKMLLETDEGFADTRHAPKQSCRVADSPVFQFEMRRQLGMINLTR